MRFVSILSLSAIALFAMNCKDRGGMSTAYAEEGESRFFACQAESNGGELRGFDLVFSGESVKRVGVYTEVGNEGFEILNTQELTDEVYVITGSFVQSNETIYTVLQVSTNEQEPMASATFYYNPDPAITHTQKSPGIFSCTF